MADLSGLDVKTIQPRLNALKRYAQARASIAEDDLYAQVLDRQPCVGGQGLDEPNIAVVEPADRAAAIGDDEHHAAPLLVGCDPAVDGLAFAVELQHGPFRRAVEDFRIVGCRGRPGDLAGLVAGEAMRLAVTYQEPGALGVEEVGGLDDDGSHRGAVDDRRAETSREVIEMLRAAVAGGHP